MEIVAASLCRVHICQACGLEETSEVPVEQVPADLFEIIDAELERREVARVSEAIVFKFKGEG